MVDRRLVFVSGRLGATPRMVDLPRSGSMGAFSRRTRPVGAITGGVVGKKPSSFIFPGPRSPRIEHYRRLPSASNYNPRSPGKLSDQRYVLYTISKDHHFACIYIVHYSASKLLYKGLNPLTSSFSDPPTHPQICSSTYQLIQFGLQLWLA